MGQRVTRGTRLLCTARNGHRNTHTSSSFARGGSMDITMNPKIWSRLQDHIDLSALIFAKLPFRKFFQSRAVCKEWNRLAADKKFLLESFNQLIPRPYFVILHQSPNSRRHGIPNDRLRGLLTFDSLCSSWNWTRLPPLKDGHWHTVMEGLLYSYNRNTRTEHHVFDLHTRMLYNLPDPEPLVLTDQEWPTQGFVMFNVVTSVIPHTFEISLGWGMDSRVYDSVTNSWTSSKDLPNVHLSNVDSVRLSKTSLYQAENIMHLTGLMTRVVPRSLVASEEDANTLKRLGANPDGLQCVKLGVLQGRMLIVNSNPHSIMWLLLPCGGQVFMSRAHLSKEFMSSELLEWLAYALDGRGREVPRIGVSFCNECVLVYSWLVEEALIERMVIFNVAEEQSWEKVEMPTGRTGFSLGG